MSWPSSGGPSDRVFMDMICEARRVNMNMTVPVSSPFENQRAYGPIFTEISQDSLARTQELLTPMDMNSTFDEEASSFIAI